MMDLDSAIQHCKEQVQEQAKKGCYSCAEEHQQLAEWLKELKAYREQSGDAISRKYILDLIDTKGANLDDDLLIVEQWIQDAPSVNPHPIECGDAISRQAVDNMLHIWLEPDDAERMILHLDEIPSVTPQQRTGRWIPISERLPEEDGRYIVFMSAKVRPIRIISFAKNPYKISPEFKGKRAGWYDYDSEWGYHEIDGVIAWMPLPAPFRAESEDKE